MPYGRKSAAAVHVLARLILHPVKETQTISEKLVRTVSSPRNCESNTYGPNSICCGNVLTSQSASLIFAQASLQPLRCDCACSPVLGGHGFCTISIGRMRAGRPLRARCTLSPPPKVFSILQLRRRICQLQKGMPTSRPRASASATVHTKSPRTTSIDGGPAGCDTNQAEMLPFMICAVVVRQKCHPA